MFLIGICDDRKEEREYIEQMCERCFTELGQACEYRHFASGEEVLSYSGRPMHLLFLDVEMGQTDGIQVLHALECTDWVWRAVLVSYHRDAVFKSFGLKTLDFGIKPVSYEQINRWLSVMIRENRENASLQFVAPEGDRTLGMEQIYCLEAAGNYTYVYEREGRFLSNGNLKSWEKKCRSSTLMRVHRSYLVNLLLVEQIAKDMVILNNGRRLPVGRKYKGELKERYRETVYRRMQGRI